MQVVTHRRGVGVMVVVERVVGRGLWGGLLVSHVSRGNRAVVVRTLTLRVAGPTPTPADSQWVVEGLLVLVGLVLHGWHFPQGRSCHSVEKVGTVLAP